MEKFDDAYLVKQCTRCKKFLSFEKFRVNKKSGQLTKICIPCLEKKKLYGDPNKCEHGKQRCLCKDCKGSSICEHNKRKSECRQCGGSQICELKKIRSYCKACCGGCICLHNREKRKYPICNPLGHLASVVHGRVYKALKSNKEMSSQEYLGCGILTLREHMESQFTDGMTWENHGLWHIDHKIPFMYREDGKPPAQEIIAQRLHYTNTQPLWASKNIFKGNRFCLNKTNI